MATKIYAYGMDGFITPMMKFFAKGGSLPNFARFLREGTVNQTYSSFPVWTPTNWAPGISRAPPPPRWREYWEMISSADTCARLSIPKALTCPCSNRGKIPGRRLPWSSTMRMEREASSTTAAATTPGKFQRRPSKRPAGYFTWRLPKSSDPSGGSPASIPRTA